VAECDHKINGEPHSVTSLIDGDCIDAIESADQVMGMIRLRLMSNTSNGS
jgi:hypothetical protein